MNPVEPRFGFLPGAAPAILKAVDYASLGMSTVAQNKYLYATCITSRATLARSNNEKREVLMRDPMGWYNWFMGTPLIQTGVILGLLPLVSKGSKELMLTPLNQQANPLKKLFLMLFNQSQLFLIASDKQLHQRKMHILSSLAKSEASKDIAKLASHPVAKLFEKTIQFRAVTALIGRLYTFLALGVLINLVNIALTKAAVHRSQGNHPVATEQPLSASSASAEEAKWMAKLGGAAKAAGAIPFK